MKVVYSFNNGAKNNVTAGYTFINGANNGEKTDVEDQIKNSGTTSQVEAVVKIKLKGRWLVFNAIQVDEVNETSVRRDAGCQRKLR